LGTHSPANAKQIVNNGAVKVVVLNHLRSYIIAMLDCLYKKHNIYCPKLALSTVALPTALSTVTVQVMVQDLVMVLPG
jgi:hypothetical protein